MSAMKSILLAACIAILIVVAGRAQEISLHAAIPGNLRYKDIGGQVYAQSFIDSFSYNNSSVTLSFDSPGINYLAGTVTATGLKPNFAYQIKLIGRPSKEAVSDAEKAAADDATNERIGRMGRWWQLQPGGMNAEDADFDAHKDDPAYIFEGYLVIGFFITDASGNAAVAFTGNNSFHVLWRTNQRAPSPNDGPLTSVTLAATAGNAAYTDTLPERPFSLYGEWQPTRALPGTLQMTDGHYRCNLLLTEESFHDAPPLGGQWSAAMVAPVEFDIPTSRPVKPVSINTLVARLDSRIPGNDWVSVAGSLAPGDTKIQQGLKVQANLFGVTREFILDSHGRDGMREGAFQFSIRRADSTGSLPFILWIRRAAFVLPADSSSSNVNAELNMTVGEEDYRGTVAANAIQGPKTELLVYKTEHVKALNSR